jgi:hypothetical protein
MAGEDIRRYVDQVTHLASVIEEATIQWTTVANLFGEGVAGYLPRRVAEAILLEGYTRQATPPDAAPADVVGPERRGT